MKVIYSLVLLVLLSACGSTIGENGPKGLMSPMPMLLRGLPQGNDNFSLGFREGCYNFIGQNGYGLNRIYDAPVNPEHITDSQYREGYKHGARYCGVYINKSIYL